ncbi:Fic family protein [Tersicoccus sp. MR15.9]|uniref:Fic family protein n=1 Tax=Tersicoccus mangrovi TaxID=3121635 RepID=UPI002FE6A174
MPFQPDQHPRGANPANRGQFGAVVHSESAARLTPDAQVQIDPHETSAEPWQQAFRGGTAEDRKLSSVDVSLPPRIADFNPSVPPALAAEAEEAIRVITTLDATHGEHLAPLSTLLLRAESVASSKIEHVEATLDDYARALHGSRANASASSMVASTRALDDLIHSVTGGGDIHLDAILRAHRTLMADDPNEQPYAGRVRDMQNWIGGSDHAPRMALYVPPPPQTVPGYLEDLTRFANRDDLGVIVQAAVAHAQFESIHPFTDGNGRIGRALINTILRRRATTHHVVVPIASALVARRETYFDVLGAYRDGDAGPIIHSLAEASTIAADESRTSARRLATMPEEWTEAAGRPRRTSATARLIGQLLDEPVFSADEAELHIGGATSSVYTAIERLHGAGVIRPLTARTRNQVWVAASLADELDDLGHRIAARAR